MGHRPQVTTIFFELLRQKFVFVHWSHSFVGFRHSGDGRNSPDVTARSVLVISRGNARGWLDAEGARIIGADGHPNYPATIGENMAIALKGTDTDQISQMFNALAEGSVVRCR